MNCKACQSDIDQNQCQICGETPDLQFFRFKEIKSPSISLLRKKLNLWSNSVPEHDLKNLGESVQFKKVQSMPGHGCSIVTSYETRTFEYRYFSGNSKRIKNRTIGIDQIDPWSFKLDFQGKKEVDVILPQMETIMTIDCPDCNAGKVKCGGCKGYGEMSCYECREGVVKCSKCHGDGRNSRTGSEGKIYFVDCMSCGATGEVNCRRCQGTNTLKCDTCRGTGEINCQNCEGNGVLDEKIMLSAKKHVKDDYIFEMGEHTPGAEHFYDDNRGKGVVIIHVQDKPLPSDTHEIIPFPEFRKQIDNIILRHDSFPQSTHVTSRTIFVERKPLVQVDYSFKEKAYKFFLVNTGLEFKDSNSPIKEFSGELVRKSEGMLFSSKLHDVKLGIETLGKSFRVGQELSHSREQYEKFRNHLAKLLLNSSEHVSDWRVGMEFLVFREKLLLESDKALTKYASKKITPILLIELVILVLAIAGFIPVLAYTLPKPFITTEILVVFAVPCLVLGILALMISYRMLTDLESRINNVIKFILTIISSFAVLYFAIHRSDLLLTLGATALSIFLPFLGIKMKPNDLGTFSHDLNEKEGKNLFSFMDRNWSKIKHKE